MNGHIVLNINGNNVTVIGGAYLKKPKDMMGVKLAEEIEAPSAIDLPIPDFSVPNVREAQVALAKAVGLLNRYKTVYVGCMGGFGRTGIFLSLLARLSAIQIVRGNMDEITASDMMRFNYPVEWVRENYVPNAVETPEQYEFVQSLDLKLLAVVSRFL